MKAPAFFSVPLFILTTGAALALPQVIGGFVQIANMNFEDFAALEETWKPGVQPKATWELWKSPEITDTAIELKRLTCQATIFGVPAAQVTVQRRDDRTIRFEAVFQPSQGANLEALDRVLRRNLAAWAEQTHETGYQSGATFITVGKRPLVGDIVIAFTPAGAGKPVASR